LGFLLATNLITAQGAQNGAHLLSEQWTYDVDDLALVLAQEIFSGSENG
jgi:hypothetical protein